MFISLAYQNQTIYNPVTGQNIRFIKTSWETSGQLLEMELNYGKMLAEPPMHRHPMSTEKYSVISGKINVRMGNKISIYKAGDSFMICPNIVHSVWNEWQNDALVNLKVIKPMNFEFLIETLFALVNDGKTDSEGRPSYLQMVLTANKFANVFRLSKPRYAIQKAVFVLFSPLAYFLGYRPYYKKYLSLKKDQAI